MNKRNTATTRAKKSGDRPCFVTDEHLEYLDELRESGETNMFGARPYLISEFGLEKELAGDILSYWMKSSGKANR